MVFKSTGNDRRHLALCDDEFRGPRSDLCRSGGINNNKPKNNFFKISSYFQTQYGGYDPRLVTEWVRAHDDNRTSETWSAVVVFVKCSREAVDKEKCRAKNMLLKGKGRSLLSYEGSGGMEYLPNHNGTTITDRVEVPPQVTFSTQRIVGKRIVNIASANKIKGTHEER
ncbi:hypothetical protein TNCV_682941 [Trichonephila clavipes]|nr:hypothetical protein TNCV_682941 [Trichonephila clavipes]